jgi:hypothetical protein
VSTTRADLHVALTMLESFLDNPPAGLSEQEVSFVTQKRVNEVARIAVQLQRELTKVSTR